MTSFQNFFGISAYFKANFKRFFLFVSLTNGFLAAVRDLYPVFFSTRLTVWIEMFWLVLPATALAISGALIFEFFATLRMVNRLSFADSFGDRRVFTLSKRSSF